MLLWDARDQEPAGGRCTTHDRWMQHATAPLTPTRRLLTVLALLLSAGIDGGSSNGNDPRVRPHRECTQDQDLPCWSHLQQGPGQCPRLLLLHAPLPALHAAHHHPWLTSC
jgi:hypothetical protein